MKTKRLTMFIEILLFASGIALACYFTFVSNFSVQINSLLCNLSIGLSTGGMVAFLIEIPSCFSVKKQNETVLHVNLRYIYIHLVQLQNAIEKMQVNSTENFIDKFWEWHFKRIYPLVFPILSVDGGIYLCSSKRRELMRLQNELNIFATNTDTMVIPFAIKTNTIKISAMENGNTVQIINAFIEPELTAFLGSIKTYIKTINEVMLILCNKKQLKVWNIQINSIKDALNKGNMDLQKSEK